MRATVSVAVVAAIAICAAACRQAIPPVPSQGGPAWTELVSDHFTLWTDSSPARGRELIAELEHLYQIVYGVAFASRPANGKSFVIALANRDEVVAFLPEMFQAYAVPGRNPSLSPFILVDAETDEHNGHVLAHELTHVISAGAIHDQPVWFAEGIAQFFETTSLDAKKNDVDVGEFLPKMLQAVRSQTLLRGAELFACTKDTCRDGRFYMTAAILYHYLANERMPQLLRLQDELAAGNKRAWDTALPDLPPDQLDAALRAWLVAGKHRVWHFHVALLQPTVTQRALGDGDVWAVRALLRTAYQKPDLADFVARAIAADPTSVLARLVDVATTHKYTDVAAAHAVMAAHPDDWRAWYLVLAFKPRGIEYRTALHQMCTLASRDAAALVPHDMCAPPPVAPPPAPP